jgi:hypothetical protein
MNLWSVTERSTQRIATEEKLGESSHPIAQILMFLLCCVPGVGALWFGIPNLPKTLSCKPDGNVAQCQEAQKFLNIPVKTRSFVQPQKIAKPIVRELGGNNTLVYGGLAYIGGLLGIIALYSTLVVSRRVWVFDRHRQVIINEKYTAIRKTEQRYSQQDVLGIVLEINDIRVTNITEHIFVRLNLQSGEQPTRHQPFNDRQPIFYDCEYNRLDEAIDLVIQPISKLLQVPYQIKFFFQQQACIVFDVDRQCVDIFENRNSYQIPFADIQGFEIERLGESERIMTIGEGSLDTDSYHTYTYRLLLITNGGNLPIHQIDSQNPNGIGELERKWEVLSMTDNRGYQWMEQLQQQLERLLTAVPV